MKKLKGYIFYYEMKLLDLLLLLMAGCMLLMLIEGRLFYHYSNRILTALSIVLLIFSLLYSTKVRNFIHVIQILVATSIGIVMGTTQLNGIPSALFSGLLIIDIFYAIYAVLGLTARMHFR